MASVPKPKSPEHEQVAKRVRALIHALGVSQQVFADASGTLKRNEVSMACNGGTLAKTEKWIDAIATASEVEFEIANKYLRGRIELNELMRRRSRPAQANGAALDVGLDQVLKLETVREAIPLVLRMWPGKTEADLHRILEAFAHPLFRTRTAREWYEALNAELNAEERRLVQAPSTSTDQVVEPSARPKKARARRVG
jgi:transcriptional regulator with XRE-family HTH domain